jgi:hypothetical protein
VDSLYKVLHVKQKEAEVEADKTKQLMQYFHHIAANNLLLTQNAHLREFF